MSVALSIFKASSLIPLHSKSKIPMEGWQERYYDEDAIRRFVKNGYNMAYRIPEGVIVLDIDPKNFEGLKVVPEFLVSHFGDSSVKEVLKNNFSVKTGAGYHIYLNIPQGIRLVNSLKSLPGLEIKQHGLKVSTIGTVHENGSTYKLFGNLKKFRDAPTSLLNALERETLVTVKVQGNLGALTPTELRTHVLDHLDISDYRTNETWFPILCACYHSTGGEAVEEFISWSIKDEKFEGHRDIIRSRW